MLCCGADGSPRWTDQQRDDRVYVAMPAGKELVLRCPAAGSPVPNVTWTKDGRRFERRLVGPVSSRIIVALPPYLGRS